MSMDRPLEKLGAILREWHCLYESLKNERAPTPVRMFRVRLHSIGSLIQEVVSVLELLGVDSFHGAIWSHNRHGIKTLTGNQGVQTPRHFSRGLRRNTID